MNYKINKSKRARYKKPTLKMRMAKYAIVPLLAASIGIADVANKLSQRDYSIQPVKRNYAAQPNVAKKELSTIEGIVSFFSKRGKSRENINLNMPSNMEKSYKSPSYKSLKYPQFHLDEDVNRIIRSWRYKGDIEFVKSRLSRMSAYQEYINDASRKYGVDKNLATALFAWESDGNIRAISPKGAGGPTQLMPSTAKEKDLRVDGVIDERFDPDKAFDAGVSRFYDALQRQNGKPIYMALSDYNFGPGNLEKLEKYHSNNIYRYLPEESRVHAKNIHAIKKLLDEGIQFPKMQSFKEIRNKSRVYHMKKDDTVYNIAKRFGSSLDRIKFLNPQIVNYNKLRPGIKLYI